MLKKQSHENHQLLSITLSVCVQLMPPLFSRSLCLLLWQYQSILVLYLETKHYQNYSWPPILTDLQLLRQSPVFLSRSFFHLCPPPLSFSLTFLPHPSLYHLPFFPSIFFFSLSGYFDLHTSRKILFFSPFFFFVLLNYSVVTHSLFMPPYFFPFHLYHFLSNVV